MARSAVLWSRGSETDLAAYNPQGGLSVGGFGHLALLTSSGIAVNEPLARRTIKQRNSRQAIIRTSGGKLRPLHGGTERRTLRTIAHRRRTRLPQVFLRGLDIRHGKHPSRYKR